MVSGSPSAPGDRRDRDRAGDDTADQSGVRLRRRDVGQELPSPEPPAGEVGARVVGPDPKHEQEYPAALATEGDEGRPGRRLGRRLAEPDDERQERGVQRPEDRREPGRQALARISFRKRPDRGQDHPDGNEDQATRLELLRRGGVEDEPDREHDPERRNRRIPGGAKQPEDLDGGKGRRNDDERDDPDAADGKNDDERRDEERGADRPLAEHLGADRGASADRQRPNRRVRLANSSRAASKASAPKSGQRTSVE